MNDRHLQQESSGTGRTAQAALFQPAAITDRGSSQDNVKAYRQPAWPRCARLSHGQYVDAFTDWIVQRADQLVTEAQDLPLVVPLTVTFTPNSIRPHQVLREYERFYARLCRVLINNPERPSKRDLLPLSPFGMIHLVVPTSIEIDPPLLPSSRTIRP
jgi:hypothetical protein